MAEDTERQGCQHPGSNYPGPERRSFIDRRIECVWHEAHEVRFENAEKKSLLICGNLDALKKVVDTKINNKLFYSTASGVFILILIILGVQWGTYEKVNTIALDHSKTMGKINTSMVEINAEVKHGNRINVTARETIKDALQATTQATNEKMSALKDQIERLHESQSGARK